MQRTIASIKSGLLSKTGGKRQSNIVNFYAMLSEVAQTMMSNVDLPSAKRIVPIIAPLYSDPTIYAMPSDFSTDGIISVRSTNPLLAPYAKSFVQSLQYESERMLGTTSILWRDGVQYLQSDVIMEQPLVLDTGEGVFGINNWATVGVSSNSRIDTSIKVQGNSSISFDVGIGTNNGVKATIIPKDLTNYKKMPIWVLIPDATRVQSITIRFGQSNVNYYSKTVTTDFYGNSFSNGWNLLLPDITTGTTVGVPTRTNVTYLQIDIIGTFTAQILGFKVDGVSAMQYDFMQVEYYSNCLFINTNGVRVIEPTSDSDKVLLTEKEYILFIRQFSEIAGVDLAPAVSTTGLQVYGTRSLEKMYERFQQMHPTSRQIRYTDYSSMRRGDTLSQHYITSISALSPTGAPTTGSSGSNGSGTAPTVYAETPSGAINGVNANYTVLNSITTVIVFAIGTIPIYPNMYTIAGNTIILNLPIPAELSGEQFRIAYV
jgi:hypothetical protein